MGKKLLRTLLFTLLFGALMHFPAWAETAIVTGSDVNMREGPGTNFRIVDCLPKGESVTVMDRSNGTWLRIEHDGIVGFMSASFLEVIEEESAQPAESAVQSVLGGGQDGYVNAMYVRLRSAPASDASVLGEYNRGKALSYYGTFGDWAACIIDGQPGFIYVDYIALGRFDGWSGASSADTQEENAEQELPLNLRIMVTPEPTPVVPTPTYSDALSLEHAETPGVEQVPGYINAAYVRFRKGPGTTYPIIETYNAGTVVGVTGVYMDWTACLIDGAFGFVYSDYVTIPAAQQTQEPAQDEETVVETVTVTASAPLIPMSPAAGFVAGNNVRMRSAPSMSAPIVDELSYGNALTILGISGDWTAVQVNGVNGFIYSQFVTQGNFDLGGGTQSGAGSGSGSASFSGSSSYEKGVQIAQYAMQFVGSNYCWGGKDPSTGFDCSGLVYYVYQQFGITLNRVAQDQARNGVHVDANELQPGDVLCFYSGSSYIGHSGIYLGYGMFVHAQNSATGVVITELAGHYAERGFEARRIV